MPLESHPNRPDRPSWSDLVDLFFWSCAGLILYTLIPVLAIGSGILTITSGQPLWGAVLITLGILALIGRMYTASDLKESKQSTKPDVERENRDSPMDNITQPNPNPVEPQSRYPVLEFDIPLTSLVGWSPAQILARLGTPTRKSEGTTWIHEGKTYVRNSAGKIQQASGFGIVHNTIPFGEPYEEWIYKNVRGSTWILFVRGEPKSAAVVEVAKYPEGAIF